jgi:hypothetical protein
MGKASVVTIQERTSTVRWSIPTVVGLLVALAQSLCGSGSVYLLVHCPWESWCCWWSRPESRNRSSIAALSMFYNRLNAGSEQLMQLRVLSETVLIPNLDEGDDEFYDETGRLRSKYGWYRGGLERLGYLAADITTLGDGLVAELTTSEGSRRR